MSAWKAILAALVIFTAGALSGSLGYRLYTESSRASAPQPPPPPGGPPMPWVGQRFDFVRRMSERLQLTPEQRQRIDRHIQESQQRMRELWEPVAPKMQEEMRRTRESIDAELTPAQREAAEKYLKERASAPRDRPPDGRSGGRWREGQPPNWQRGGPRDTNAPARPPEERPPSRPPSSE